MSAGTNEEQWTWGGKKMSKKSMAGMNDMNGKTEFYAQGAD